MVLVGIRLVNTPTELAAFRESVGAEVATVEAGIGTEVVNSTHSLNRERIKITGTPDRSVIVREYPAEGDLARLAQVAAIAIANTDLEGQELRAFGYNIELIYEPPPGERAIHYLLNRLFMPDLLRDQGMQLFGGAGRLFFEKDGRNWQAVLEPRFREEDTTKIFASLNLHRPEIDLTLLTEDEIGGSLRSLWAEVHNLVYQLDARGR